MASSTAVIPSGTEPATVIIYTPPRPTTTNTATTDVPKATTTTVIPTGTGPATVLVEEPACTPGLIGHSTTSQIFQVGTSLDGQSPVKTGQTTTLGLESQCSKLLTAHGTDTGADSDFTASNLDDATYVWFGDKAKTGFNNDNADVIADCYAPTSDNYKYTVQNAGDYIPFRLVCVNAQQCGAFGIETKDPPMGM
ncbi:Fc.00g095140.m01.CDS01 [Cosmosporella sp. VM-42]